MTYGAILTATGVGLIVFSVLTFGALALYFRSEKARLRKYLKKKFGTSCCASEGKESHGGEVRSEES